MRTTIELDADTSAAVEQLRRADGLGVSEAVNELIRRGLVPRPATRPFVQRVQPLGIRLDVSNVADALEVLEGADAAIAADVLVDANILLYAIDTSSPHHDRARAWLESALSGPRRVGLPWQSLMAFIRIATNPRAVPVPLSVTEAWAYVEEWLDVPVAWIPQPGIGHRAVLGRLLATHRPSGNLVPDAVLAALCVEHGLTVISADSDFARFTEISWVNPLAE